MHADRNSRALPTPGTPAYWQASRDAFALLGEVKTALDAFATACERFTLRAAADASEDDEVAEREGQVGSWERAYALIEAAWSHPFAARVLHARGLVPSPTAIPRSDVGEGRQGSAFCVVHRRLP